MEREHEVVRYRDAFCEISRVALAPEQSRQLMLSVAEEYDK